MTPYRSYSLPLDQDRRLIAQAKALRIAARAIIVGLCVFAAVAFGHITLKTALNLTTPSLPAGCC